MNAVCVFCGSNLGLDAVYAKSATRFGEQVARRGLTLVYGGGCVGLMGAVADGALAAGGRVVGVIPQSMMGKEIAHDGLTELRVVASMHERKAMMAEVSDAFVALPGGVGTMEEFFEIWTWGQLGLHAKPYGLLDVDGFYAPLITFLDHLVEQRFVKDRHRQMLIVSRSPEEMLDRLMAARPVAEDKWLDRAKT